MQPLTTKELGFMSDMLGAEQLLIKTCAAASIQATQPEVRQFLHHAIAEHQRRHDELIHVLEQHEPVAHA